MPVLVFRLICWQLYLPALQSAASLLPFCFCRCLARILNLVLCHPCDLSAKASFSFPIPKVYWSLIGKAYGSVDVQLEWSFFPSPLYPKKYFALWYNMSPEYICNWNGAARGVKLTYVLSGFPKLPCSSLILTSMENT